MSKKIDVTELILRDAHQSLMATRMALEDMVPACADLDQAGYWSVECWGGATFDSCIRFLNEDPWERLRTFRKLMPNTRLQMLLRGQNLLGYRHYEDTVVDRFVEKSAENGMDVFRVFDALNDIRNLRRAIAAVRRTGKHAQGTICYTVSPLHTTTLFVEMAEKLIELGCDSICIKDMAALLKPQPAYEIVKGIKEACGEEVRLHVHVHATTGVTMVSLMKAIEAGADCVDTSISSLSLGPGHNPTESLVEMLEGTGFTTSLDMQRLLNLKRYFNTVRPQYQEFLSNITGVETEIFSSQIPGGMISNMENQLKQQGAGDKLREVLEEVPLVRKDAGYPPLVTPSSQIVGSQAVFNVMMGRYKVLTGEFSDLMLGYYGETIGRRDRKLIEQAAKQAKKDPIDCRPADLLKPEWENLRAAALEVKGCNGSDEDVLTHAMFPQVAVKFFGTRDQGPKNLAKSSAPKPVAAAPTPAPAAGAPSPENGKSPVRTPVTYDVKLNGHTHRVTVTPA
ncbi:MAG TPA: methylmalonyl-CoA carboxytransferase subunit 5S [Verrucomicrobiae bacterium]|nr:methylmalonyl-CoA carboxytransferase subunit 5S [Verrucomicrobiae bacterium]